MKIWTIISVVSAKEQEIRQQNKNKQHSHAQQLCPCEELERPELTEVKEIQHNYELGYHPKRYD